MNALAVNLHPHLHPYMIGIAIIKPVMHTYYFTSESILILKAHTKIRDQKMSIHSSKGYGMKILSISEIFYSIQQIIYVL